MKNLRGNQAMVIHFAVLLVLTLASGSWWWWNPFNSNSNGNLHFFVSARIGNDAAVAGTSNKIRKAPTRKGYDPTAPVAQRTMRSIDIARRMAGIQKPASVPIPPPIVDAHKVLTANSNSNSNSNSNEHPAQKTNTNHRMHSVFRPEDFDFDLDLEEHRSYGIGGGPGSGGRDKFGSNAGGQTKHKQRGLLRASSLLI